MEGKIRYQFAGREWQKVSEADAPERANFVIVCRVGDWSGFRTLAACLAQQPWTGPGRPDGYYWIEER